MAAEGGGLAAARAAALAASSELLQELGLGGVKRSLEGAAGSISAAKAASRRAKTARRTSSSPSAQLAAGPRRRSMRQAGLNSDGTAMEAGVQQTIEPFKAPPKPARRPGALALDAPDVVEEGDARDLPSFLESSPHPARSSRMPWSKLRIRHENHAVKGVKERIYSIAFHPGHTPVALAGDKKGNVCLWRPQTDGLGDADAEALAPYEAEAGTLLNFRIHSRPINALKALPNTAMTCSYEGSVRLLDLEAGVWREAYAHWPADDGPAASSLTYADISEDARVLVAASSPGEVAVLDTRTLPSSLAAADRSSAEALVVDAHDAKIASVALHPDGTHVATAAHDNTVCIWDLRKMTRGTKLGKLHSGTPLETLQHAGSVTSAFFSSDGARLVSTSNDDLVRVWHDAPRCAGDPAVTIKHNNHTGRWLSNFRCVFDPADSDVVVIGAMTVRHIEAYSAVDGKRLAARGDELLTAVPTLNAVHPSQPLVVSGTASGRLHMWSAGAW